MRARWTRRLVKRLTRSSWRANGRWWMSLPARLAALERKLAWTERNVAFVLKETAEARLDSAGKAPQRQRLADHEFKVYSQNGEDGILQYIFAQIGTTDRRFVEIGVQNGTECNTAFLSTHCGWQGLLVDGNVADVAMGRQLYRERLGEAAERVQFAACFVTRENVNEVFREHGYSGELDLLSIDIDGNDYWIWEAVDVVQPRVVVVEYNASLGTDKSLTVAYDPTFDRFRFHPSGYYHGASLLAFTRLAERKGYELVGCTTSGANAFFVRKELCTPALGRMRVDEAYYPLEPTFRSGTPDEQYSQIASMTFVQI